MLATAVPLELSSQPVIVRNGVMVLSGYGIKVAVERRHLVVSDGIGRTRRQGRFARATARLKRLVVLGHDGMVTLAALRWLHGIGAAFVQIDRDLEVIVASGPVGLNDPRLRRAQALAMMKPHGVEIARSILKEKLLGEDTVLSYLPAADGARMAIQQGLQAVDWARSLDRLLVAEAAAAAAYWEAWTDVSIPFVRTDLPRIPEHWLRFGQRRSPVSGSSRLAANPANALLNYLYAILEAEARIACLGVGLDPGLGILHADQPRRDSLALDIMEAGRPKVDAYILEMLQRRAFRASDFYETPHGVCRLMPTLTHLLAATTPMWAREVAPVAERVGRMLARSPGSKIRRIPTPLTQANRSIGRSGITRTSKRRQTDARAVLSICKICGAMLDRANRSYCTDCLREYGAEFLARFAQSGSRALARMRTEGRDPAHGGTAALARSAALSKWRREVSKWDETNARPNPEIFRRNILPRLQTVSLGKIVKATGLSVRYCWLIREGLRVPHPRHWGLLMQLGKDCHG